jgi:hypothetical protein
MIRKNVLNIVWICSLLASCGIGETISFKGVPFDQPGVKEELKKICQENQRNKDDRCAFKETRGLMRLSYGVLSDSLGWITLGKDDSLIQIEIEGSKADMFAQVDTLSAKYGKPEKVTEQVTNGLGTKFDKEIFTWTDSRGSRITVESIYSKVDRGRIVIDSASSVAAKKTAEKLFLKAGKENL